MIFCTGNPARKTIAYVINPDRYASLSTGYDFKTKKSLAQFANEIEDYAVFVNSAFVAPGVQQRLMHTCYSQWMQKDNKGHIINIGTTLENTDDASDYNQSKQELRKQSLQLSNNTGISGVKTTYVVLGGIGDDMCDIEHIGSTIRWIIEQPFRIPMIQIESVK
jgi:short-subunit dehydrogenase